jgi:hypothetical protein
MNGVLGIANSVFRGHDPVAPSQAIGNVVDDMECDTLCSGRIIPLDVGPQSREVVDCLGRPYPGHDRVGFGFSSLRARRLCS